MPSEPFVIEDNYISPSIARQAETPSSSPSGGLAFASAALAERQQMDRDSTNDAGNVSNFDMLPMSSGEERLAADSWVEVQQDNRRAVLMKGEDAEAGTSYAISDSVGETWDGVGDRFQSNITGSIIPESFEEQMMLAMAVSLAEARPRTNGLGVAWL